MVDFDNKTVKGVLRTLIAKSGSIEATAVISRDGICLSCESKVTIDPDRLGAISATLLGLSDTAVKELARGHLQQVLLYGNEGVLLLFQIGKHHVLAISAKPDINVGMILLEARKVSKLLITHMPAVQPTHIQ